MFLALLLVVVATEAAAALPGVGAVVVAAAFGADDVYCDAATLEVLCLDVDFLVTLEVVTIVTILLNRNLCSDY